MTTLVTEDARAPEDVRSDAQTIVDRTEAPLVTIEDAVDDNWFIRVEGPAVSREDFEHLADTVQRLTQGGYQEFSKHWEVGPADNEWLIRIEY